MDWNSLMSNPQFLMGMGMLSGNYGTNKRQAFANAMGGGLQGLQMAQMASMRDKAQKLKEEQYQKEIADEQQKRLQAALLLNQHPEIAQKYFPGGATDSADVLAQINEEKGPAAVQKVQWAMSPAGQQALSSMGISPQEFIKSDGVNVSNSIKMPSQAVYITPDDAGNFMMADGSELDPSFIGKPWQSIPPGTIVRKPKAASAESAGKMAMIDSAREGLDTIENLVFGGDATNGEVDRGVLFGKTLANVKIPFTDIRPIPGQLIENWSTTRGGQLLASMYEKGIQAITRTETGAAMPDSELGNTRARFEPGPGDSIEAIREKFLAYKKFLNNSKAYLKQGFNQNPTADNIDFDKLFSDVKGGDWITDPDTGEEYRILP